MSPEVQIACYRLIAELLLHPEDRDLDKIDALSRILRDAPERIREPISRFLNDPVASSRSEYVQTLELSPPCPLYLGSYLFDEPTTCRGIGTSGRNAFMLELRGLYGHFGFQMQGGELADYLPILVDFLGISLDHQERDRIGLRRRFLEHYVLPGLEPFRKALDKYNSPYSLLVSAVEAAVEEDRSGMGDQPAWQPPPEETHPAGQELPCTSGLGCPMAPREASLNDKELTR